MNIYIVDASVAAKWFIEEQYREAALSILDKSNELNAPDSLLLEMDNVICKWVRRGAVNQEEGNEFRNALRQYPIKHHPFGSFQDFAFTIACETKQSIYDCLYVALAAILKGRMVTADRKFYNSLKNSPFKKNMIWVGDLK